MSIRGGDGKEIVLAPRLVSRILGTRMFKYGIIISRPVAPAFKTFRATPGDGVVAVSDMFTSLKCVMGYKTSGSINGMLPVKLLFFA